MWAWPVVRAAAAAPGAASLAPWEIKPTYKTRSTYGKAGDTLRLDIDPKSHPAWTGGQHRLLDTGGQLARFNKRFQGFGPKTS